MFIGSILPNSLSNGTGTRMVIFFTGCSHKCPGCHNEFFQDISVGKYMKISEVVNEILKNKDLLDGITLSGGEPFEQADSATIIARVAREEGLNVWTYTGYTYNDLAGKKDFDIRNLLEFTDVLVDGPFIEELKDENFIWRGSRNQRILYLTDGKITGIYNDKGIYDMDNNFSFGFECTLCKHKNKFIVSIINENNKKCNHCGTINYFEERIDED